MNKQTVKIHQLRNHMVFGLFIMFLMVINQAQATININTASTSDLEGLPGITAVLAERIVDQRIEQGPFSDPSEIMNVLGIGPKTYDRIKDLISVDESPGTASTDQNQSISSAAARPAESSPVPSAEDILTRFNHEPTVYEVQKAAIDFAQIQSDDIRKWKRGVRLQAFVPETVFGIDYYNRESTTHVISPNVDFRDEPDRYIIGPDEHRYYDYDYDYVKYRFNLRWDLQKYVFDRSDLSVRSEAEDLVDFRTKVVEDITKLYFERRRLQIDALLKPAPNLKRKIQQELRIQELTSLLDSLTGGFFLQKLADNSQSSDGVKEGG